MPRGAHRLSLLGRVAALLRQRRIPFALVGAAAMAVRGVSRSTRDVNLLDIIVGRGAWQARVLERASPSKIAREPP